MNFFDIFPIYILNYILHFVNDDVIYYFSENNSTNKINFCCKYKSSYLNTIKNKITSSLENKLKYHIHFLQMKLSSFSSDIDSRHASLVRLSREYIYISFLDSPGCIFLKYAFDDDYYDVINDDDDDYIIENCYDFDRGIFMKNNDFTGHIIISDNNIRNRLMDQIIDFKYLSNSLPLHNYILDKNMLPLSKYNHSQTVKIHYNTYHSFEENVKYIVFMSFELSYREYNFIVL